MRKSLTSKIALTKQQMNELANEQKRLGELAIIICKVKADNAEGGKIKGEALQVKTIGSINCDFYFNFRLLEKLLIC